MPILISHRANTSGPNTASHGENHPSSIKSALMQGFYVEIDVRFIDGKFLLGHDAPEYEVPSSLFYNDRLFVHCKDVGSFYKLINHPLVDAFMHDNDDVVATAKGKLWSFPRAPVLLTDKSIAVMAERVVNWDNLSNCYGICTDYPIEYKKNINWNNSSQQILETLNTFEISNTHVTNIGTILGKDGKRRLPVISQ